MTDTAIVPAEITNPLTGELVPTNDLPAVAVAIVALKEYRERITGVIREFDEAVLAESRRQGTKTLMAGGSRLEVSADSEIVWDVPRLQHGLAEVGCPEERIDALVKATISYRVDGAVARQLASANPEYAAVIECSKSRIPKTQYVRVKT